MFVMARLPEMFSFAAVLRSLYSKQMFYFVKRILVDLCMSGGGHIRI